MPISQHSGSFFGGLGMVGGWSLSVRTVNCSNASVPGLGFAFRTADMVLTSPRRDVLQEVCFSVKTHDCEHYHSII